MTDDSMSDDDKTLFREHMRSVTPLNEKTKRVTIKPAAPKARIKKINPPVSSPKNDYYLSDYISETVLSDSVLFYCHPSVPSKRFRSLKQGQIPFEARLDLHGLKAETARDSLYAFIKIQGQNNTRCLLIIHGKGGHQGAPPVIKNLVNRWLPQFDEVLAFHSAQPKDGGHGAIYVLLKRNRESW